MRARRNLATDILSERHWDAVLVDHSIGADAAAEIATAARHAVARRIVLITPGERHRLPALKEAGFTGYLVKPVRAASLKAQLVAAPAFDEHFRRRSRRTLRPPTQTRRPLRHSRSSVLVAEDNEINALLTRSLLTRLGHRPERRAETARRRSSAGRPRARPARPTT